MEDKKQARMHQMTHVERAYNRDLLKEVIDTTAPIPEARR